jgi:CHASE2 domain-containing sensor protein
LDGRTSGHIRERVHLIGHLLRRSFWINPASLMLASLLAVLALYGFDIPILELLELKTYDLRFVSRGVQKAAPAVAMVVIVEKSLEVEGRYFRSRLDTGELRRLK